MLASHQDAVTKPWDPALHSLHWGARWGDLMLRGTMALALALLLALARAATVPDTTTTTTTTTSPLASIQLVLQPGGQPWGTLALPRALVGPLMAAVAQSSRPVVLEANGAYYALSLAPSTSRPSEPAPPALSLTPLASQPGGAGPWRAAPADGADSGADVGVLSQLAAQPRVQAASSGGAADVQGAAARGTMGQQPQGQQQQQAPEVALSVVATRASSGEAAPAAILLGAEGTEIMAHALQPSPGLAEEEAWVPPRLPAVETAASATGTTPQEPQLRVQPLEGAQQGQEPGLPGPREAGGQGQGSPVGATVEANRAGQQEAQREAQEELWEAGPRGQQGAAQGGGARGEGAQAATQQPQGQQQRQQQPLLEAKQAEAEQKQQQQLEAKQAEAAQREAEAVRQDAQQGEQRVVNILHFNDWHNRMEPTHKPWNSLCNPHKDSSHCTGGIARMKKWLDDTRGWMGKENTLVLNAGDDFIGTVWDQKYGTDQAAHFLNMLGVDAMTVGNHEFDWGLEELAGYLDRLRYPALGACNIEIPEGHALKGKIREWVARDVAGVKVCILGLTTSWLSFPERAWPLKITDAYWPGRKCVERMRAEGCQVNILLSHLGFTADIVAAELIPGLDVVVGGHSHSVLWQSQQGPVMDRDDDSQARDHVWGTYPTWVASKAEPGRKVAVVQAGWGSRFMGALRIWMKPGSGQIERITGWPVLLGGPRSEHPVAEDPGVVSEVRKWRYW